MKVRMLTSLAGIGFAYGVGDIVDLPKAEAANLIDAEIAEEFTEKNTSPTEMRRHIADLENQNKVLQAERDALKADVEALRDQIDILTAPPEPAPEAPEKSGEPPAGEAPSVPSEPAAV